ncbi:MAG: class I tRNA ligase family protein, partial [Armatimonadia bacterium]
DEALEYLVQGISPIAPHIAAEMWEGLGKSGFLYRQAWPEADLEIASAEDKLTIVVQVNSKVRDKLEVPAGTDMAQIQEEALKLPNVVRHLEGKQVVKVIAVPGKLVNVVVK